MRPIGRICPMGRLCPYMCVLCREQRARLAPQLTAHRFSSRERFGLVALYIGLATILSRNKDK
jgi:hypothetical protein